MKALGCHIVAEFSHCDADLLTDVDWVRKTMLKAAEVALAEIREEAFHRFEPHGVSGVVVLSESHISIHTWPELGYAAVDIYTCGNHAKPHLGLDYLAKQLKSRSVITSEIDRGTLTATGAFAHSVTSAHQSEVLDAKTA